MSNKKLRKEILNSLLQKQLEKERRENNPETRIIQEFLKMRNNFVRR